MKRKFLLCCLLLSFVAFTIQWVGAQEVIIETRDGGKNLAWYTETEGNWYDSVAKSSALGTTPNIGSRFCDIDYSPDATARFTPDIAKAGKYEVFVTWSRSGNVNNAKYLVHHSGEEKVVYLDQDGWGYVQSSNANFWHSLGVYEFPAGKGGYVEVTGKESQGKPDPRNIGRLYTDAIKFVPVGADYRPSVVTSTPSYTAPTPIRTPVITAPPTPVATPSIAPVVTPYITPAITPSTIPAVTPSPESTDLPTPSGINWLTDVQTAQAQAQATKMKILVYFYTDKSTYSKKYESEVFTNLGVITRLNQTYICLKFDLAAHYQQAYMLGAYRAPTFIVYDSMGNPLGKIDEFLAADRFLSRLAFY